MKIALVISGRSPRGHVLLDNRFLDILSEDNELVLVDDGTHFTICQERQKYINHIVVKPLEVRRIEILKFICNIINNIVIALKLRKYNCDRTLFLTIRRNGSLFFSLPFFRSKIAVMHHYDIDNMKYLKLDRFLFNLIKNKIDHIFLADYIRKGTIKEYNIKEEKTFVVHQPLKNSVEKSRGNISRSPVFIGLGRNNDKEDLFNLIEIDKKTKEEFNFKLIMRSFDINYKGSKLEISDRYFTQSEFDDHLCKSYACVVNYPKDYKLRYSGIIDDALSHGMKVYCNQSLMGEYFKNQYPCNVEIFDSLNELYNSLRHGVVSGINESEYNKFIERHSDNYVKDQFDKIIK